MDGDTGGKVEHFEMRIKSAERLGISALIIEDKKEFKKKFITKDTSRQTQEEKLNFQKKISVGKKAQISDDFMIIARIESFILGKGLNDAISRTHSLYRSRADGIMIHSKSKNPKEVIAFSKVFRKSYKKIHACFSSIKLQPDFGENFVREWLQHSYICKPYAKSILSCNAACGQNNSRKKSLKRSRQKTFKY